VSDDCECVSGLGAKGYFGRYLKLIVAKMDQTKMDQTKMDQTKCVVYLLLNAYDLLMARDPLGCWALGPGAFVWVPIACSANSDTGGGGGSSASVTHPNVKW
jgi:hypothetical protein